MKSQIYLSDTRIDVIKRLERDLAVFGKSEKTMDTKEHHLHKMGMKFVEHDERIEKNQKAQLSFKI